MIPAKRGPPLMRNVGGGIGSSGMMLDQSGQMNVPGFIIDHQLPYALESDMGNFGDLDLEISKSADSDLYVVDGDEEDTNPRPKKKSKTYHRHTPFQISEMEALFKVNPHPDDKQRKDLSVKIDLDPTQIKFWFQNKRTQVKNKNEKIDNSHLRAENDKLMREIVRMKEALANATCPNCGGPKVIGEISVVEQQLRLENGQLRQRVDWLTSIASKYEGKLQAGPFSITPSPVSSRSLVDPAGGNLGVQSGGFGTSSGGEFGVGPSNQLPGSVSGYSEIDESVVIDLAVMGMEELVTMAQTGEPLWVPAIDGLTMTISEEVYVKAFPKGLGPKPHGFKSEASKETAMVFMNPIYLVGILMNANYWSNIFSGIVSNALTSKVLSTGVAGTYDGALQFMSAEFYLPSPTVPARESRFLRYCKQQSDGIWAVVDVSIDCLYPDTGVKCVRRPSGCLIRDMSNGCSEVTWVEHVEVDDRAVHSIFKSLVNSGLAFGAKRWMATLNRQCQRLAGAMADSNPSEQGGVIKSEEARRCMLKVAERMMTNFFSGLKASTTQIWTDVSRTAGAGDVKVMTRKIFCEPGRPSGMVLSAAISFWLPVSPNRAFDYLRDETNRKEWDVLSVGGQSEKIADIYNGHNPGNSVFLLHANNNSDNENNMALLQESCTDSTGSYVVYAPIELHALKTALSGGDPEHVPILPSGFAILPDGQSPAILNDDDQVQAGGTAAGCLVTAAFQILVDSGSDPKLVDGSVETVNTLVDCTVARIKSAMAGGDDV